MAIRYAVANGNWSNTATWDGGTLPTSADDVFANNRTVTIDQDITAISLRNVPNTTPAITGGGSFVVSGGSGTRNITLSGTPAALVPGFNTGFVSASGALLNITATGSAITNINANLVGGGGGNAGFTTNVFINGNSTVNITGRVGPSPQFLNTLISQFSGATINIVGSVFGTPGANGISITQPATVTVTGNVTGSTTSSGPGIAAGSASTINVTGNVFGGGVNASSQGIFVGGSGSTVNVTGNLTGGGAAEALGDNIGTTNAFNITGNSFASSSRPAVVGLGPTLITINGNLINNSGVNAVYAQRMRISPSASQTWTFQTSGLNRLMYTENALSGFPAASDVRAGISYASGTLTGTCIVPSPSNVAYGVPVDNTVGIAIINTSDISTIIAALVT
jgi:hypothetical protein